MSDKSAATKEYTKWLDGIGLSAPGGSDYHYDEIPGFVNSGVFGHFSLDDLDFGEDLTKGRIDFDDEYLLKSPGIFSGSSPGTVSKTHDETGYAHSDTKPRYDEHRTRTDTPKQEPQRTGYHYDYGNTAHNPEKTQKRQMPTTGGSVQESLFAGMTEAAGLLGVDSKVMDGVKNYMDKAPTQWKLRQEERQYAKRNPVQKEARNTVAVPRPVPTVPPAQPMSRPMRQKRAKGQRKASPLVFVIILLALIRLMSYVYQTLVVETGPVPTVTPTITQNGGKIIPADMVTEWEDAFERLTVIRESNDVFPFMEISVDDAADYLTENGWDLVTVSKAGEDSYIDAEFEQTGSIASIHIDSTTVLLQFFWMGSARPESEISHAWEAIMPEDESVYPGIPETQMLVSPNLVQSIRIYGEESIYGRITEHFTSVGNLFIGLFEDKEGGWDLHIYGGDERNINIGADNDVHYFDRLEITGPENENFR